VSPVDGKLVLLDRDGVIVSLVPDPLTGTKESPYTGDDVRVEPGAIEALRTLVGGGATLAVVSNQPAVAKGTASWAQLEEVHDRVGQLLEEAGVPIRKYGYCFHHPQAQRSDLRGPCTCRKPEPGLLLDAAAALGAELAGSWMIGDSDTDVMAGQRVGCGTVLLTNPDSSHRRKGLVAADIEASDLRTAVDVIMADSPWRGAE
jgi:D-glycero-D-manno-heptose 1,7-bisphosphate phosphatase